MIRICLLLVSMSLAACGSIGMSNPFSTSPVSAGDVYYANFEDIPIPIDLSVDLDRSLVTLTQDGTKVGLLTLEGNIDPISLTAAMTHNMKNKGWSLKASVSGIKTVQVYMKDKRYAIIYYYEQMMDLGMEVWVGEEVREGAYMPVLPASGTSSFGETPPAYDDGTLNNSSDSFITDDSSTYQPLDESSDAIIEDELLQ